MEKEGLEKTVIYFGTFLLILLLFIFMALSFRADTLEEEVVSGDRYATNLSANEYEVIDISNATGGIKKGSLTVFDAQNGEKLQLPFNYTVVSYKEGVINVTRFYDKKDTYPETFDIGVTFTAYVQDKSATTIVAPLLDLLEMLVGLIVPIGLGIVGLIGIGYLGRQLRGG